MSRRGRRYSNRRGRRDDRPTTSSRRSWWIASAIVGIPLLFVAAGGVWLKWSAFQYEYDVNLCLKNQPLAGHTILVIDATDVLDQAKTTYLENLLNKTKRNLKPFAKFSIFSIDRKHGGFPRQVFSLCNPGTAATTNILHQAPSHVQRKFDEKFERPLDEVAKQLKGVKNSEKSPLLETIQTVSELHDFSSAIPERRLILFSDMLQNSKVLNHYAARWHNKSADIIATFPTELHGVEATVHYVIRRPDLQDAEHREFWRSFFTRRGAIFAFFTTG